MTSELENYTQKLLDRTRARNEALHHKMQEHAFQARKRRPLENQENTMEETLVVAARKIEENFDEDKDKDFQNKRSRMEQHDSSERGDVNSAEETASKPKAVGGKSVSERMKRLLNQRKLWEAADEGEDVNFESAPSPVHHKQPSPAPNFPPRNKIDIDRKARFAALAQEFNSREDDMSHPVIPSPDCEKSYSVIESKSGTADDTTDNKPSEAAPEATNVPEVKSKPIERSRPAKSVSQRVSLSIETLSQFASTAPRSRTPLKTTVHKKLSAERITVGSCDEERCENIGHQVTPASKTLHERLIELQKHGCKAERSTSAEKVLMENDKTKRDDDSGAAEEDSISVSFENKLEQVGESLHEIEAHERDTCMAVTSLKVEGESFTENEQSTNLENSDQEDSDAESGLSFNDSMMDEIDESQNVEGETSVAKIDGVQRSPRTDVSVQCDLSISFDSDEDLTITSLQSNMLSLSVSDDCSVYPTDVDMEDSRPYSDAETGANDQMIDDLFEGVSCSNENLLDPPFLTDISNVGSVSLTQQKSKHEIQTELSFRRQTCNEAEDTHSMRRNPSRQLRPLARSSSSESVVSLVSENPTSPEKTVPMFTIDSYRNEKRKSVHKVQKKIIRKEEIEVDKSRTRTASLKERNAMLLDEVQHQQRIIQQASAALNCCYDVHHGKGSITELEAEKLLLIASEKRLALLAEIQKLKSMKRIENEKEIQAGFGSLTIEDIELPLRTEYIFSMASKKDGGENQTYYYFILVRQGPHKILATHLASTHDNLSGDSLLFKNKFQFDQLESDFEISIEVYTVNHRSRAAGVPNQEKSKRTISGLIHKRRALVMRKKLEGALQKTKARVRQASSAASCSRVKTTGAKPSESLTPRKLKTRSIHGSIPSSPGGPNAIRISNFTLIGSATIKLDDVKKNKFVLQKVPFLSPISGQLQCKIVSQFQSSVEQRGFLTLFDDVGGLGAWHRRWCTLQHGVLYSWTYPDDEKHKDALSKIELRQCTSKDIRTVERIMCARPNTFELRTMRPRRHGDKENLISQDTGSVITTRHWLAADTKEERLTWIESLNQALIDVRAWDTSALGPMV